MDRSAGVTPAYEELQSSALLPRPLRMVASTGLEPVFTPSEGAVLPIKRQGIKEARRSYVYWAESVTVLLKPQTYALPHWVDRRESHSHGP